MKYFFIILALFFQINLSATQYSSKALKAKDYEELRDILNKYIKNSQDQLSADGEGADEALEELKKALKILFMKPDTDIPTDPLLSILQNEIIQYQSFMAVLHDLIKEAIKEFKLKKGSIDYQTSLLYLLENSLSYLHSINNKESNAILKDIKGAKLKISKKIFNYLLLEMGRGQTASPSYLATQILKAREKELKKAKKARLKKAKKAKLNKLKKAKETLKEEKKTSSEKIKGEDASKEAENKKTSVPIDI